MPKETPEERKEIRGWATKQAMTTDRLFTVAVKSPLWGDFMKACETKQQCFRNKKDRIQAFLFYTLGFDLAMYNTTGQDTGESKWPEASSSLPS